MQPNIGNAIVVVALAASIGATVRLVWGFLQDADAPAVPMVVGLATASLVTAYAYLASLFVTADFTNDYVWKHVSDTSSLSDRLAAVYAGPEGSLLLCATAIGVAVLWLIRRGSEHRTAKLVGAVATALLSYFVAMVLLLSPFEPLDIQAGAGLVFGPRGLHPLLDNVYFAIRPPVTFAGFAALVVPFAIGVGHFVSLLRDGDGLFGNWLAVVTRWLRVSWVLLTASIAVGALWSYNTPGWGGLWVGDPVETAALASWLFLTATVHAVANYRKHGQNPLLAAALSTAAFPAVLFAGPVAQASDVFGDTTRVHTFGNGATIPLVVLLGLTAVLAVGLPIAARLLDRDRKTQETEVLALPSLVDLSILLISALTLVLFWGLSLPAVSSLVTDAEIAVGADLFTMWGLPLVLLVVLLLGFYNDFECRGRRALLLLGVVAGVTLAAAFVPLDGWQIDTGASDGYYGFIGGLTALVVLPPVAYAAVSITRRAVIRLQRFSDRNVRLTELGRAMIHLGVVLVVLSSPFTYVLASQATTYTLGSASNQLIPVEDSSYALRVSEYTEVPHRGTTELSPAERDVVLREISDVARRPEHLAPKDSGFVLIRGRITEITQSSPTLARLNGTDVYLGLDNSSNARQLRGRMIIAQGRLTRFGNGTLINPIVLGLSDPLDALVPELRSVTQCITVDVFNDGSHVASGKAGITSTLGYQNVHDVLVHRGLTQDTSVIVEEVGTDSGSRTVARISVKRVPLMNVVRLGFVFLVVGGLLSTAYGASIDGRRTEADG